MDERELYATIRSEIEARAHAEAVNRRIAARLEQLLKPDEFDVACSFGRTLDEIHALPEVPS